MTEFWAAEPQSAPARFRLRLWPIVAVLLMGFGVPLASGVVIQAVGKFVHLPGFLKTDWATLDWQHLAQALLALLVIMLLKPFVKTDFGLHLPRGRSYVPSAIGWGLFFGVLMTTVDYGPQILAHTAPKLGYPLNRDNLIGWLTFEGLFVGPTEEIPFRSLMVGYLAWAMPGQVRFLNVRMNGAGVVVAVIFALAHIVSFWTEPVWKAAGQQVYAFALGVFYAYWFEKSRSVLAPIVGHNVSDVTEYALLFAIVYAWS